MVEGQEGSLLFGLTAAAASALVPVVDGLTFHRPDPLATLILLACHLVPLSFNLNTNVKIADDNPYVKVKG
jgi:hypothetical protein